MDKVGVKKSKLQGKGVFALQNIKRGDVVLDIDDSHMVIDASRLTRYQNEYECDYLEKGKVVLMQPPENILIILAPLLHTLKQLMA